MKIYMNANIMKAQFFYFIKYDLKGHKRSQKMTFLFKSISIPSICPYAGYASEIT